MRGRSSVRGHGVRGRGGDGKNATTSLETTLTQGRYSRACSPPLLPVSGLGMASYGDTLLRCSWCGRWRTDSTPPLTDIDGAGLLCEPCEDRGCPPQYNYAWWLLGSRLSVQSTWLIANFAYPACVESGSVWQTLCKPSLPAYPLQPPLPPGPGSGNSSDVLRDGIWVPASGPPTPKSMPTPPLPSSEPATDIRLQRPGSGRLDVLRGGIWVLGSRATVPDPAPKGPPFVPSSRPIYTDVRLQQPGSGSSDVSPIRSTGIWAPASGPPAPPALPSSAPPLSISALLPSPPAASALALPSSPPLGCARCRFSTSGCNHCRGLGFFQCRHGRHRSVGMTVLLDAAAALPPSTPLAPPPMQAGSSRCRWRRSGCAWCN